MVLMISPVKVTIVGIYNNQYKKIDYEGLSTDDRLGIVDRDKLNFTNIGSSYLEVDTGAVYKLNTDKEGKKLKWYQL